MNTLFEAIRLHHGGLLESLQLLGFTKLPLKV
jgi:hypothetical protein